MLIYLRAICECFAGVLLIFFVINLEWEAIAEICRYPHCSSAPGSAPRATPKFGVFEQIRDIGGKTKRKHRSGSKTQASSPSLPSRGGREQRWD